MMYAPCVCMRKPMPDRHSRISAVDHTAIAKDAEFNPELKAMAAAHSQASC
jgi:hypothetical protein